MNELSYYSILVAVRSFDQLQDADLKTYCESANKMNIHDLFLALISGAFDIGDRGLSEIVGYCSDASDKICNAYGGIEEGVLPIYRAYLIPPDYRPQNDIEEDTLVELLENVCGIEVNNETPEWYLKESLKYRLLALYLWVPKYFFKLKGLLGDVQANKVVYDSWINKVR